MFFTAADDNRVEHEELDLGQGPRAKVAEVEDEMDVDSFLEKGFFDAMDASDDEEGVDSDDEESEPSVKSKSAKTVKPDAQDEEDELKQHKRDLEELKKDKRQASFLEYLAKESPGLLEDLDMSDEGEDGEAASGDEDGPSAQPVLTLAILEMWKTSVLKEKSVPALKRLTQAFRIVCHMNDNIDKKGDAPEETGADTRFSYRIADPEVFNDVIVFLISNFARALQTILGKKNTEMDVDEEDSKSAAGKNGFNATRFPKWAKVKDVTRSFFANLIHFISQLSDSKMLTFVLQHLEGLIKYLSPFSLLQKRFLKVILNLWSSASAEAVRIFAFFSLRKMALELPYPFIDHVLKGVYLTYVRNCKFVNRTTWPLVNFLCNCVVEIYGLDFVSSYQHAFIYIRELASHLRNSYTSKKKAARKSVYNFQYINSIWAWVKILAAYPGQEALSLLHYPLVQLIQGTISYQPTNRYFPLRLRCVQMLNDLARASKQFINAASYVLEILASSDMYKHPKPSMEKSLDLRINLKVSKVAMGSKIYQDSIFDESYDRLVEYLALYSRSIAFPELVFPIINALNKFKQSTRNVSHSKRAKQLLERIHATVKLIQAKRNSVTFSAKEIANVSNFLGEQSTPLTKMWVEVEAAAKAEAALAAKEANAKLASSSAKSGNKKHLIASQGDDDDEDDSSDDEREAEDDDSEASELEILGSDDDMVQEIDGDMLSGEDEEEEDEE